MKRLLVISSHFPPSTVAGVPRTVRLVRMARRFGWETCVLTRPAQCQWPPLLGSGGDWPGVPVRRIPCRSVWWHEGHWPKLPVRIGNLGRLAVRAFARLTARFVPIDADYPWSMAAAPAGVAMVRRYGVDLIWSSAPPASALFLARRIGRQTGVPYVVDFRDVGFIGTGARARRAWQLERAVLRDAAGLIYVSPPQRDLLQAKHPLVANLPQRLVYNGFDALESPDRPGQRIGPPLILHGGRLYGGKRRLDGLLAALAILRHKGDGGSATARFQHYGLEREAGLLNRGAGEHGVSEAVRADRALPRTEFLAACLAADVLLVVVGHDTDHTQHAGAIPAKLYDYFAAGRPILVLGPKDCEAARMVERLNRGLGVPDDAPEQIAVAIERLLARRGADGELDLTPEAVAQFEAPAIVRQMAEFFSEVISGRSRENDPRITPSR